MSVYCKDYETGEEGESVASFPSEVYYIFHSKNTSKSAPNKSKVIGNAQTKQITNE